MNISVENQAKLHNMPVWRSCIVVLTGATWLIKTGSPLPEVTSAPSHLVYLESSL